MFDVGRVCVKLAGRDAGQKCVVVKQLEGKYVLIDGMTRRKKCNTLHLEPLEQMIEIKENASHDDVISAFKDLGHEVKSTNPKAKATRTAPVRKQLQNAAKKTAAPVKEKKKAEAKPKAEKKAAKKE